MKVERCNKGNTDVQRRGGKVSVDAVLHNSTKRLEGEGTAQYLRSTLRIRRWMDHPKTAKQAGLILHLLTFTI